MDEFHLLRPWWLLAAVACLAAGLIARRRGAQRSQWHTVMDAHLAKALLVNQGSKRAVTASDLLWLLLTLGMLALCGPTWSKQLPADAQGKLAVVVILANSDSMYAGDALPNRNRAAKAKIDALRKRLPQAAFAVVVYDRTAHLAIPLTADERFFELYLQPLEPELMPRTEGTATGLEHALQLAERSAAASQLPSNLLLISDNLDEQGSKALAAAHGRHPALQVLVAGTAAGAALRFAPDGAQNPGTAVPLASFAALKAQGIAVTQMRGDDQDVAWLARHIERQQTQQQASDARWQWQDSGYLLVSIMLLPALWLQRRIRLLSIAAPLLLLTGTYTGEARADWQSAWWTADQQGQQAMENGDYKAAGALFADPYRQGRAYYLAKDYAQAAAAFRQVHTAEGYFYLANSLAQQSRYQVALKAYQQALELDPQLQQARANAKAVQAALDAAAQRPGQRQPGDPEQGDVTGIVVDVDTPRSAQQRAPASTALSEAEVQQWMANVKSSPRDMLKALFLLQSRQQDSPEQPQ